MSVTQEPDEEQPRWPKLRVGILLVVLWLFFVPGWMVAVLPLTGAVIRFRAHYRPRRQATDTEAKLPAVDAVPIRWYHSVFPRVWMLEGWAGLWKGLVPCIFYFVTWSLFKSFIRNTPLGRLAAEIAWLPCSVCLLVVINREITHPQSLDWARWKAPRAALLSLFTPSEQAYPQALLYKTFLPLLAAEAARTAVIWGSTQAYFYLGDEVTKFMDDRGYTPPHEFELSYEFLAQVYPWILALPLVLVVSRLPPALILCPLEVVVIRISSQPAISEPEEESTQKSTLVSTHEPVIQLRNTPYDGLIDCFRCMTREEGWRSLYSAFWMTLLFTIHGWTWKGLAGELRI